ncbi:hypothetical protein ACFO0N_11905 [Halobium salinum]|uniref:Flagellin N-terminal-like domain-containing protein n=1 Tax=Halobium salinum TaxID=1364940 RepID=A0ABD5PCM6_9EURY|nr:hypothetical protein [Halobium salinum]
MSRLDRSDPGRRRAQANVVGVAILLGLTMLSLGALTATVGTVVQQDAAAADAGRVAADLDGSLNPVSDTGAGRGRVSFTEGRLGVEDRTLRVLNDSGTVATVETDALVFESGTRQVAFTAGAVTRGSGNGSRLYAAPPVAASRGTLLVGAGRLNASATTPDSVASSTPTSLTLRTNVTHRRRALGNGSYRVAVETTAPRAWERHFERANASVSRRDFDGDGVPSVVADYRGDRVAYLVVHDMRLEVTRG